MTNPFQIKIPNEIQEEVFMWALREVPKRERTWPYALYPSVFCFSRIGCDGRTGAVILIP